MARIRISLVVNNGFRKWWLMSDGEKNWMFVIVRRRRNQEDVRCSLHFGPLFSFKSSAPLFTNKGGGVFILGDQVAFLLLKTPLFQWLVLPGQK